MSPFTFFMLEVSKLQSLCRMGKVSTSHSSCQKYDLCIKNIDYSDVKDSQLLLKKVVCTRLQVKLYVINFRFNIDCAYTTSHKLYVLDSRLSPYKRLQISHTGASS